MLLHHKNRIVEKVADFWLLVAIHIDGFCANPRAYLTATKWWLLRKRVRARGQFAPLLSRSPNAYTIFMLREDRDRQIPSPKEIPPIVALVDCSAGVEGLDATIQSLISESIPPFIMGVEQNIELDLAAEAIDWGSCPWLMIIEAGNRVAPGAAGAYRAAMADPAARVIYSDDDLIGKWGRRTAPHFKPDWNGELFTHFDYVTGACIVRVGREDLDAVAGHHDWAAKLVAAAASAGEVRHLTRVLHHRTCRIAPAVAAMPLERPADLPLVSVIVPTRNRVELLRTCLDGLAVTDYPGVEVIVVDNDSDDIETLDYLASLPSRWDNRQVRVLRHAGPFNYSAINNRAVAEAQGQLICLLNNDIEMIRPDWLSIMATQAVREDVGAVGAQLLYPDGRIQHAGVVIGVGNAAGHAHRLVNPAAEGYFRRHALPQFTAAVTAACLVVQRDRFLAVGGLDEKNFAVAFNDVDLCLRLKQRGWQSLYEPRAVLIHHESVSRGNDLDPIGAARFAGELAALKRIWRTHEITDPYHHPNLSRASEQFAVAI